MLAGLVCDRGRPGFQHTLTVSLACWPLVGISNHSMCVNNKVAHVCVYLQNAPLMGNPPCFPARAGIKSKNTFGPLGRVAKSSAFSLCVIIVF